MSDPLCVASVQFQHRANDKQYNLGRVRHFVAQARAEKVRLLIFPEMCLTGYWHVIGLDRQGLDDLAEPIDGGMLAGEIAKLAAEADMIIGAGLLERAEDGTLYNAYMVCQPDGTIHTHRKIHAFENEHIASGDRFTVFDSVLGVKLGILICWDNNLVENVRATALLGADILIAPHQTGGTASRSPHAMGVIDVELWRNRDSNRQAIEAEFKGDKGRGWLKRWLPARAHDNGMFLIFSNGVGEDEGEVRTGNAMILDPYGRTLVETWAAEDKMVIAELDLTLLPMSTGRRWIRGRRPELYKSLTEPLGHELDPRAARFSDEPVGKT